jgi:stalled ribosome rescue protein Dom34
MKKKQIGIWMDHSNAFLMELENDKIIESTVDLEITQLETDYDSGKNEKLKNTKSQQLQSYYYKKLIDSIKNYEDVILFGPTDAKSELLNLLKTEHFFKNIHIEMQDTDKMTTIQMHDFVTAYFK